MDLNDQEEEEKEEEEEEVEELSKSPKKKRLEIDEETALLLMEKTKIELQEAFQVTSTSKYLESRYLVLNSLGMICCYNEQIHISFHDVSYHHSITIDNKTTKYTLGDLSSQAVLLASEENPQFLCLLYQSWDTSTKQWIYHSEKSDPIQLVKLTDDYVLLFTQFRFIRLFTLSGIQQRILRFQGPILSLTSFANQIFLIHHSSHGQIFFFFSFYTLFINVLFPMSSFRSSKRTMYVLCDHRSR